MVKPDTVRYIAANMRLAAEALDKVADVDNDAQRASGLAHIMLNTGEACAEAHRLILRATLDCASG